ncbi:hypothetical protein F3Y22_tig00009023pilonHSYRG00105 [Hibiscus syriacus]|uniref:Uncharacterized protein n=1 Tax=Hibiscus syriacus TaxID=106335 RepID=A0A6A3C6V1_HIBSY|nr:hypothetical protein F3Y22_tig00009023pilonHSYRG00105 [Hibiscus syriacus]
MIDLLETHISNGKVDHVISKFRFDKSFRVEAVGFPRVGEFNAILSSDEKRGYTRRGVGCKLFQNFMHHHGLFDLGFKGPKFTWMRGGVFERLYRMIVNDCWNLMASKSLVKYLSRIKSDHMYLLLLSSGSPLPHDPRPFRFLADWTKVTRHPQFSQLIWDKWRHRSNITKSLNNLWNSEVYAHIIQEKNKLKRSLATIQADLDRNGNDQLIAIKMDILSNLEDALNHEEPLWYQKSSCQWITEGDQNTKYFKSWALI